jgi:glutamyl-tRNA synthetase
MNWKDPNTGELTEGFKEKGFLPEAFINFLALLGWNDGTEQEIFSKEELVEKFSMNRVHSAGAKFDYEKAKWFNHEWIKKSEVGSLKSQVRNLLYGKGITDISDALLDKVIGLVKDRCTLLTDFYDQSWFFFKAPETWDLDAVRSKWNEDKKNFFLAYVEKLQWLIEWNAVALENIFKELAAEKNIKPGELQLPFRVMLVGGKFGPPVFQIAELLGPGETSKRIKVALKLF